MSISSFMADYKNWTAQGPRADWRQWWRNGQGKIVPLNNGSAQLDEDSRFASNTVLWEGDIDEAEGDIHLAFIVVNYEQMGTGLGRQVIKILAALADKHQVILTLEPMMKGSGGLTTPQLDSWYRRLGWDTWDHPEYGKGPVLIRYPRGGEPEPGRVASRFLKAAALRRPPRHLERVVKLALLLKQNNVRTAASYGDQVFVLRPGEKWNAKLLQQRSPIKNGPVHGMNKPRGGFWTSTLKGKSSDWLDWCSRGRPEWVGAEAIILDPSRAKVLHIGGNVLNYIMLTSEYEHPGTMDALLAGDEDPETLDWEQLSKGPWDGVHVTKEALRLMGQAQPGKDQLYGWDAESTVWWNPSKLLVKGIIAVEQGNTCRLRLSRTTKLGASRWIQAGWTVLPFSEDADKVGNTDERDLYEVLDEAEALFSSQGVSLAPREKVYSAVFGPEDEVMGTLAAAFGGTTVRFSVAVNPRFQRRGVARALIQDLEKKARGKELEAWVVNRNMAGLLESLNFEADDDWEDWASGYVFMRKHV